MKERIEYIDIGKGCAILLMVMGHIIAWEYPKEFIQDSGGCNLNCVKACS